MDRDAIEKELEIIMERTRKLINDAYVCGYKDGYCECIGTRSKINNEIKDKKFVYVSASNI